MDYIKKLNEIRELYQLGKYRSGDELEKDMEKIISDFWTPQLSNLELFNKDMSELVEFHHFLIHQVIRIHQEETSLINQEIFSEVLQIKDSSAVMEDGKRALNQYFLGGEADYYFVGDLHSDDMSLVATLDKIDFYDRLIADENVRLVFTGDYVDRGRNHLKILQRLLMLKYLFPGYIFLLRGNHDGGHYDEEGQLVLPYRVPEVDEDHWYFPLYMEELIINNNSVDKKLLLDYFEFFDSLAYITHVMIGELHVVALHGGLPRPNVGENYDHIGSVGALTDVTIKDVHDVTILHNIIWSDPDRGGKDLRRHMKRFQYTKENFKAFSNRFGVDILVRGHEAMPEGYKEHFDGSCITIFSSGRSEAEWQETAYGFVEAKVLHIDGSGEKHYI